ncbi:hypothetical protein FHU38_001772 [Saccharomonospora amisosensis]|uniref:DUF2231 domain-containing protein n=1 Tax=Saccharomonospora amisosensis TaxID=1128677 RepID=A0A7X5UPM0_9PSEU|nr:DUF2231 domain-containing protein [Saccharomonospora amisosensis]NIJ11428.1 hypothetical protein [Saccharomonospora amisosensis]
MFETVFGLPVHPLVVHATVVVVPLAAVVVILAAVWPRFRGASAFLPLALSVMALVLVPVSVESGQSLAQRSDPSPLIESHQELGEGLLPWVGAVVLAAAGLLWLRAREARPPTEHAGKRQRLAALGLAALALASGIGTTVHIVRIGHSGAESVWTSEASR